MSDRLPLSTARPASSVREAVAGTPLAVPVALSDIAGAPVSLVGRTLTYELRTASGALHADGNVTVTDASGGLATVALGALATTQGGVYYLRVYVREAGGSVLAAFPAGGQGAQIVVPGAGSQDMTVVRLAAALAPESIRASKASIAAAAQAVVSEAVSTNAAAGSGIAYDATYADETALNAASPANGTDAFVANTGDYWQRQSGAWVFVRNQNQTAASSRTAAEARRGGPGSTLLVDGYGLTAWSAGEPDVDERLPGIAAEGGGTWLIQSREAGVLRPEHYATPAEIADPDVCSEVLTYLAERAEGTMSTLRLDPAREYEVTAGWNGESTLNALQFADGVRLRSGMRLDLNGATVRVAPTASGLYAAFYAYDAEDVWIGNGRVVGDRDTHLGVTGEFGHLLAVQGGQNVHASDLWLEEAWGDGAVFGRSLDGPVRGFSLTNVWTRGGRRQGISFTSAEDGVVLGGGDFDAASVNGTNPGAGLDFEPDNADDPNRNIRVVGRQFAGNIKSIGLTVANENIEITGCQGTCPTGIAVDGQVNGLTVTGGAFGAADHADVASGDAALLVLGQTPGDKRMSLNGVTFRGGDVFTVSVSDQDDDGAGISMTACEVLTLPGQTKNAYWIAPASRLTGNRFAVPADAGATGGARYQIEARRSGNSYDADLSSAAVLVGAQEGTEVLAGVTDQDSRTGTLLVPTPAPAQGLVAVPSMAAGASATVNVPGVDGFPPVVTQVIGSSGTAAESSAVRFVASNAAAGVGVVTVYNGGTVTQTAELYYLVP